MKTYTYEFDYYSFITYAEKAKTSKYAKEHGMVFAVEGSKSFTGTKDMADAVKTAKDGWDYGLKELGITEGVAVGGGSEFTPNVHGAVVNVGNYLLGLPDSMYEITEKREYNLEPLTLYINLTYSAYHETKAALDYCKALIEFINKKQTTHNVRIIGLFMTTQHAPKKGGGSTKAKEVTKIVIKDFDRRFVINNIAYAFHPSFFRRIWFRHLETRSYGDSGYGMPLLGSDAVKECAKFRGVNDGKSLYFDSLNNYSKSRDLESFAREVPKH